MNAGAPYRTACKIQRILFERCKDPDIKDIALGALARSWDVLEERKRILRMKPLPKSVDVQPKVRKGDTTATSFQ